MAFVLQQGSTASTGDQGESSALYSDWMKDHGDGKYYANAALIPGYSMYRAFQGRNAWKARRSAMEDAQDARDAASRANKVGFRGYQLDQMQGHEDANRGVGLGRLDQAFGDGTRQAGREDQYGAEMNNALAGLVEENRSGSRANVIAQAKHGRLGGSRDIEQQSRLGAALQSGVMDASAQSMRRLDALNNGDLNQYYSLRRSLLSGDPQQQAAYAAKSQGINDQMQQQGRLDDYLQTRAALNRQGADQRSRMYGGIGQAGADYVDQTYGYGRA